MKNPSTKSLFGALVEQEITHARQIELELEKLGFSVEVMDEKLYEKTAKQGLSERIELDDESANMSFLDGLVLALEKERAAFQLYTQLLGQTQDLELRNILMALAEEEMRHILQFEREYEALTHHKD